ncbi:MAG: hypothetical protein ACE5JL_04535 [Dehalococcoidia bacterium]
MRKRPGDASELERAAELWKEGTERREVQQIYREPDASPVSFRQIPLQATDKAHRRDDEIGWRQHRWGDEDRPRQIKMNAAMICRIAQHLKAAEWARAMGKTKKAPGDGYDLEKAAERWKRQKELEQRGLTGK